MNVYLSLPLLFLRFWYIEVPKALVLYFSSFNMAFLQLFSLGLMVRTFFRPLKNEYREGLIGFSIGMGIVIKTMLILVDLLLLLIITGIELILIIFFLLFPLLSIYVLLI